MLIFLYIAPVLSLTFAHSSYNVQFMLISAVHLSKTSVTYTPSFCKHVLLKTEMLLSFLITNTHTFICCLYICHNRCSFCKLSSSLHGSHAFCTCDTDKFLFNLTIVDIHGALL